MNERQIVQKGDAEAGRRAVHRGSHDCAGQCGISWPVIGGGKAAVGLGKPAQRGQQRALVLRLVRHEGSRLEVGGNAKPGKEGFARVSSDQRNAQGSKAKQGGMVRRHLDGMRRHNRDGHQAVCLPAWSVSASESCAPYFHFSSSKSRIATVLEVGKALTTTVLEAIWAFLPLLSTSISVVLSRNAISQCAAWGKDRA